MSDHLRRRSTRARKAPGRFRFSQFAGYATATKPPPVCQPSRRLVFESSADAEPPTPRTPDDDPLGDLERYVQRTGGFAVVNDYDSAADEASYSDGDDE